MSFIKNESLEKADYEVFSIIENELKKQSKR